MYAVYLLIEQSYTDNHIFHLLLSLNNILERSVLLYVLTV